MSLRRPRPTLAHLWAAAALAVVAGATASMAIGPADFWHFLEGGQEMIRTGTVLDRDLHTFTAGDRTFVNLHWGSQVLLALLFQLGGLPLVVVAHAAAIVAAFGLVLDAARRQTGSLRIAAAVTLAAFAVAYPGLGVRPQAASVLLFAATAYLLSRRWLWPIPVVFAVWANTHLAFPMGLLLLAGHVITPPRRSGPTADGRLARDAWGLDVPLAITGAVALGATLVNPWGLRLHAAMLDVEPLVRAARIGEWMPADVRTLGGAVFFGAVSSLLLARACARRPWGPRDLLILASFTYLALREERAAVWWALAAAPLCADTLAAIPAVAARRARADGAQRGDRAGLNWLVLTLLAVHVAWCTPWLKDRHPFLPAARRALLAPDTPVALTRALAAEPRARRIFAEMTWGGYLGWALDERHAVYYDSRVTVFPPTVIRTYVLVSVAHAGWERALGDAGVDALALSKTYQPLLVAAAADSPAWTRIFEDGHGVAYVRAGHLVTGRPAGPPAAVPWGTAR